MNAIGILGRLPPLRAFTWNLPLLTTGLYLAGSLLVAAALIALVRRWRKSDAPEELTPSQQLAQYRSLYEQGAISQDEFHRLRALLSGQMRDVLGVPAPPAPPETKIQAASQDATPPGSMPSGDGPPPPESPETGIRPA
jgi:hypothetical protein